MIDHRCQTCRHWQAPATGTKGGHCGLDDQLAHAGYSCARFAYRPAVLVELLGISRKELVWLQGHRDDPTTDRLRLSFACVQTTNGAAAEVERFQRQLEQWRDRRDTLVFEDYARRMMPLTHERWRGV